MKSLKKRIREEMILTNEDKIIFEILEIKPNLQRYEELGRKVYRRLVIEKCNECEKANYYTDLCPHKYKPIFTKDWGFRCFIRKDK